MDIFSKQNIIPGSIINTHTHTRTYTKTINYYFHIKTFFPTEFAHSLVLCFRAYIAFQMKDLGWWMQRWCVCRRESRVENYWGVTGSSFLWSDNQTKRPKRQLFWDLSSTEYHADLRTRDIEELLCDVEENNRNSNRILVHCSITGSFFMLQLSKYIVASQYIVTSYNLESQHHSCDFAFSTDIFSDQCVKDIINSSFGLGHWSYFVSTVLVDKS